MMRGWFPEARKGKEVKEQEMQANTERPLRKTTVHLPESRATKICNI